jgi:hypothetical protein
MTTHLIKKPRLYDELAIYHQIAIDMRFIGFQYKEIAGYLLRYANQNGLNLKLSEGLVRQWFSKNGICKFAFDLIREERGRERDEDFSSISDFVRQGALESLPALIMRAKSGNVLACVSLLKFAGLSDVPTANLYQAAENEIDLTKLNDEEIRVLLKLQEIQNDKTP